jgi:hypothetical protein
MERSIETSIGWAAVFMAQLSQILPSFCDNNKPILNLMADAVGRVRRQRADKDFKLFHQAKLNELDSGFGLRSASGGSGVEGGMERIAE